MRVRVCIKDDTVSYNCMCSPTAIHSVGAFVGEKVGAGVGTGVGATNMQERVGGQPKCTVDGNR